MNHTALLLGLGLASALLVASLAAMGDLTARMPLALAIWGAAHALYLAASWIATRSSTRGGTHVAASGPAPNRRSGRFLILLLCVGLIPRLALLPAEPTLSEDLYRYLWDGRLVVQGVNPYAHPPSDPSLTAFRAGLYERLNHPDVPTVYPPAAQLLFAAAVRVEPSPGAWKGLLLLIESLLLASLAGLLARRGLPPERLLLYYWNPLVIVECYGSGHLDLGAAAFLLAAIALFEARRSIASGVALGFAIGVKLLPVLLIVPLLRRKAWGVVASTAVAATLLTLPFAGAGSSLADGLAIYARHWEFNGPLYSLARQAFPNGDGPRLLLATLFVLAALVITARARTLSGAALGLLVAFLLTSPTVYPWYLIPAIALLPLHPDAGLLAFSGLVPLVYLPIESYRASGAWNVPAWILAVEYGGMVAAWCAAAVVRARERAGSGPYERRAACTIESTPT